MSDRETHDQDPSGSQKPATDGIVLERGKRLSESQLWPLTRRFYDEKGPAAWQDGPVPFYITSNPFIAHAYAQLIVSYLRDLLMKAQRGPAGADSPEAAPLDPSKPIYIIELAAGHGQLSFFLLKQLLPLIGASSLRRLKIRYVMTDFAESNLRAFQEQPQLKPFVEAGVLDFARFDVERSDRLQLVNSGELLSPESLCNPLIVIANYIFDTVLLDGFKVQGGKLYEAMATLYSPRPEARLEDADVLGDMETRFEHRPITLPYYEDDPALDRILALYAERLADTHVVFPIAALRCMRRLLALSAGRMLVLSSDKGYASEDELSYLSDSYVQHHDSVLSTMVNFHALAEYVRGRGGYAALTTSRQVSLKTAALLCGGSAEDFADTLVSFQEHAEDFGPYDFYTHVTALRSASPQLTVEQIHGVIKLSRHDPSVFFDYSQQLVDNAAAAPESVRYELGLMLERLWEHFYPFGRDLPFELARVYLALGRPVEALRYNEISLRLFGEHAVTLCNMAMCHYQAENLESAMLCLDRSLALDPEYSLAKAWRARVRGEQERRTGIART
ncbi:MAG: hypothetical protein U1A78_22515 [Polyangia bacterium]